MFVHMKPKTRVTHGQKAEAECPPPDTGSAQPIYSHSLTYSGVVNYKFAPPEKPPTSPDGCVRPAQAKRQRPSPHKEARAGGVVAVRVDRVWGLLVPKVHVKHLVLLDPPLAGPQALAPPSVLELEVLVSRHVPKRERPAPSPHRQYVPVEAQRPDAALLLHSVKDAGDPPRPRVDDLDVRLGPHRVRPPLEVAGHAHQLRLVHQVGGGLWDRAVGRPRLDGGVGGERGKLPPHRVHAHVPHLVLVPLAHLERLADAPLHAVDVPHHDHLVPAARHEDVVGEPRDAKHPVLVAAEQPLGPYVGLGEDHDILWLLPPRRYEALRGDGYAVDAAVVHAEPLEEVRGESVVLARHHIPHHKLVVLGAAYHAVRVQPR
mmetsp:Transcript_51764/g.128808  ORF Transcript_51764/g.128808 Transcript_51764/m.128808 type:complete len:374 (+) Transcript_51764:51-1172(+)